MTPVNVVLHVVNMLLLLLIYKLGDMIRVGVEAKPNV